MDIYHMFSSVWSIKDFSTQRPTVAMVTSSDQRDFAFAFAIENTRKNILKKNIQFYIYIGKYFVLLLT